MDFCPAEGGNDNPRGRSLPWWPLPPCHLQFGALHHRLSWTGLARRNCSGMVPKVSFFSMQKSLPVLNYRSRCDAKPENLDNKNAYHRSHERLYPVSLLFHHMLAFIVLVMVGTSNNGQWMIQGINEGTLPHGTVLLASLTCGRCTLLLLLGMFRPKLFNACRRLWIFVTYSAVMR